MCAEMPMFRMRSRGMRASTKFSLSSRNGFEGFGKTCWQHVGRALRRANLARGGRTRRLEVTSLILRGQRTADPGLRCGPRMVYDRGNELSDAPHGPPNVPAFSCERQRAAE